MKSNDLENYYVKGRTSGSKWNFDLQPLITDFNFYDFCCSANSSDHGGFLVITDKQYVVGYNAGFGEGAHVYAFARCMKDMQGGGDINSDKESFALDFTLEKEYLFARIIYEMYEDEVTHQKKHAGYIVFPLADFRNNKNITKGQFEQFLKFYEKYNDEIKYVYKKFNFVVDYTNYENDRVTHHYANSLDGLRDYLSKHIVDKKSHDNHEIILNQERTK